MKRPPHAIDIFLGPGEHYFGGRDTRIRTVLGSCISITLWHPKKLIGGMCHFMLPGSSRDGRGERDGRFADDAMSLLIEEVEASGSRLRDFEVKMIGGGKMFARIDSVRGRHVGGRNIEAGRRLLASHGIRNSSEHIDGAGHRSVVFDIWSGHVWVKHHVLPVPPPD